MESFEIEKERIQKLAFAVRRLMSEKEVCEEKIRLYEIERDKLDLSIQKFRERITNLQISSSSTETSSTNLLMEIRRGINNLQSQLDRIVSEISSTKDKVDYINHELSNIRTMLEEMATDYDEKAHQEDDSAKVLKLGVSPLMGNLSKKRFGKSTNIICEYVDNKADYHGRKRNIFIILKESALNAMDGIVPNSSVLEVDDYFGSDEIEENIDSYLDKEEHYQKNEKDITDYSSENRSVMKEALELSQEKNAYEDDEYNKSIEDVALEQFGVSGSEVDAEIQADMLLAEKMCVDLGTIEEYKALCRLRWKKIGDRMYLIPNSIERKECGIESNVSESGLLTQADKDDCSSDTAGENISSTNLMRDVLAQNVMRQKLPSKDKVSWDGNIGDSDCRLKDDAVVTIYDKSTKEYIKYSGKDFKCIMREKYGQDYVRYDHRDPDFEPFEVVIETAKFQEFLERKYGKSKDFNPILCGHVYVDDMGTTRNGGEGTFRIASENIAKLLGEDISYSDVDDFMKMHNLTWHECGDRHTVRMVPSEINQVFSHTGGIGIQQDFDAFAGTIGDITGGRKIKLYRSPHLKKVENLSEAIEGVHRMMRSRKKK